MQAKEILGTIRGNRSKNKKIKRIRLLTWLVTSKRSHRTRATLSTGQNPNRGEKHIIKDHRLAGLSGKALVWPVTGLWVLCVCPHIPPPRERGLALKSVLVSWKWWHAPLIPAHRKQKQTELCEFKNAQLGEHNEFQASQGFEVNPSFKPIMTTAVTPPVATNKQTNKRTPAII